MPHFAADLGTLVAGPFGVGLDGFQVLAFLCKLAMENKRALLIVDEAQNLTGRAVEELLEEILGAPLSLGTVMAREREMAVALAEPRPLSSLPWALTRASASPMTGWRCRLMA